MSDPSETDPTEELDALIARAIAHLNADEKEPAQQCVDKILAADPENLIGHVMASDLAEWTSPATFEHLMFVLDRDIKYSVPWQLEASAGDRFIERMFDALRLHRYQEDPASKLSKEEINDKYIEYATRVLAADRPAGTIHEFCEVLDSAGRYEDVIKLAQYAIGDVTAEELGWPGLKRTHEPQAALEIDSHAATAFRATGRFEEGCRWVFRVVQQFPDKLYPWRLLADTLCWVGYPEESARALIGALKRGYSPGEIREFFEPIAEIIHNPSSPEVDELRTRVCRLQDKITPELKPVFMELLTALGSSMRRTGSEPLSPEYIEHRLGMKLPHLKQDCHKLVLPKVRSNAPFVREIIAFLDKEAGGATEVPAEGGTPAWHRQYALKEAVKEREKVAVGADGASSPTAQGFALYQFGIDVTEQARKGDMPPIVGRDREIERMIRILVRTEKNNPILLGEAGVGKTAIVHGLAQRIVAGTVPPVLQDRRVIELNMGVLVAGTTYRGDFEQRIVNIVKETRNNPNIILFIDEMHTLIGAGDGWNRGLDASNMMKPALASGELRLIGATTASEYSRSIEKDPALDRRFSPIWLKEIDQEMTLAVLRARLPRWHKHHGVEIDDDLLRAAVQLTDQHVRHRHFPDKAIDLIDESCALARVAGAQAAEAGSPSDGADGGADAEPLRLTRANLQQVVDDWTGAAKAASDSGSDSATNYLDEIVLKLRQHVVGHDKNLERLAAVVADEKLGLRVSRLPRVLLFSGRANTGKTECGRTLAQILWPDQKDRFLFINMAFYDDPSRVTQLIGVPPGYAGSNESGLLSLHLRQHPHSIIYLYNFHKAHERVLRLFANLFCDGSVPDARGQSMFAGSAIFILSATFDDAPQVFGFAGDTSHDAESVPEITDLFDGVAVPDEILDAAKDLFWFDQLNEVDTKTLIAQHLSRIVNQPGLRERGIPFDDDMINDLASRFRQAPPSARNLKALLNQVAYPLIKQQLERADRSATTPQQT